MQCAVRMLEVLKIIATVAAAVCWFRSSRVRLTPVAHGLEELDKVKLLSADLQTMGRWNCGAAAFACVAAVLEVIAWIIHLGVQS
jgi:hypothetical protein